MKPTKGWVHIEVVAKRENGIVLPDSLKGSSEYVYNVVCGMSKLDEKDENCEIKKGDKVLLAQGTPAYTVSQEGDKKDIKCIPIHGIITIL